MDRPQGLALLLVQAFVATGALALLTFGTPYDVFGVAPWALLIGGPAGVYALAPLGTADARSWARACALALPVAALAFLAREGAGHLVALDGATSPRAIALVALHALLVVALLAAWAARRRQLAPPSRSLRLGWPLFLVAFAPVVGDALGPLVMALQVVLLVAILRPAAKAPPDTPAPA